MQWMRFPLSLSLLWCIHAFHQHCKHISNATDDDNRWTDTNIHAYSHTVTRLFKQCEEINKQNSMRFSLCELENAATPTASAAAIKYHSDAKINTCAHFFLLCFFRSSAINWANINSMRCIVNASNANNSQWKCDFLVSPPFQCVCVCTVYAWA